MTETTAEHARELLAGLRDTFAIDGYIMDVEAADPGLHIVVSAGPDACADCLVPMEVFHGIVSSVLEKGGLVGETIQVTYPTVAPH